MKRCEENSKNCFEEIERARHSQLSFYYGPKGAGDMEEKITMEGKDFEF